MVLRRAATPAALLATAFGGYFAAAPILGRFKRNPPELWLGSAAAAALGARNMTDPRVAVKLGGALGLAGPALVWWYLNSYSPFPDRTDTLEVGETFPDFSLPTSTGGQLTAGDLRGDRVLLLCYRGGW